MSNNLTIYTYKSRKDKNALILGPMYIYTNVDNYNNQRCQLSYSKNQSRTFGI